MRQVESRHKLEVNLLKERVSQLELENYNLKEQVTKFTNFQKGCNKRMGRIDNDLSRIKQKESEKKSTDSVSSFENSDEHSSNSAHARVSNNGYARQEIHQNGSLPSYAATTIPITQQTIPARRLSINETMNPHGGQNSVNRFTTGPSGNMEDNNTRSTVHIMETRNFRPTVSPTISKQVQFPRKVSSMRENFTTTPPQQGKTSGRPYYQKHSAGVNLRNKKSTYENSEILLLIDSNGRYNNEKDLAVETNLSLEKKKCPTIDSAINFILEQDFDIEPETVITRIGTNDLDYMSASEVKDHILDMISILNQKIPTSQVVISGLLPRGDYLNDKVIECNRLLAREINTLKNTRFIDHTNISSSRREILFDNKHLTKYVGVPLLKQNILKAVSPFTTISNKPPFFGARLQNSPKRLSNLGSSHVHEDPRDRLRTLLSTFLQQL